MAIDDVHLAACYHRLERPLFNVLFRWLWERTETEDLMHDAFARVWAQRARVDPDRLDALIYTTALNLTRNRLRWRRLRVWVGLDDEEGVGATQSLPDQLDVRQALSQLSEQDRNMILLSEFSGLDTRELSSVLGIAEGTVGSRKHRAMARLRRCLEHGDA